MTTRLAELGPSDFGDALFEAQQCRQHSALFDFSFMSRARVSGPSVLSLLNSLQARDLSSMLPGDIRYCLSTDIHGIVQADITVWKISGDCYEIYSGRLVDIELVQQINDDDNAVEDLSSMTYVISLQGPDSLSLLSRITRQKTLRNLCYFQHAEYEVGGIKCRIGRLGYTGEKGFEIIVDNKLHFDSLWQSLAESSQPAGMSAIDILRIEAGFLLFLNECRLSCSATELGLAQFSAGDESPGEFKLVCFRADGVLSSTPWAPNDNLLLPDTGEIAITSASPSVLFDDIIGLGFVKQQYLTGQQLIDSNHLFANIVIVDRPLFDPQKSIPRADW